jgi:hypothetical protein
VAGNAVRRQLTAVTAAAVVVASSAGSGQSARGHLPVRPTCSAAVNDSRARTPFAHSGSPPWTIHVPVPGLPGGHLLYLRFCGHARALVRLHRMVFRISDGGHCVRTAGYEEVAVGVEADAPAPPGTALLIEVHSGRAGRFRTGETPVLVLAAIQLPGVRQEPGTGLSGTITIARSLQAGTFALRLHDGTSVTGSWTCGTQPVERDRTPSGRARTVDPVRAGDVGHQMRRRSAAQRVS